MINNPGLIPHVAPWQSFKNRIKKINQDFEKMNHLNHLLR